MEARPRLDVMSVGLNKEVLSVDWKVLKGGVKVASLYGAPLSCWVSYTKTQRQKVGQSRSSASDPCCGLKLINTAAPHLETMRASD